MSIPFQPRGYQKQILDRTELNIEYGKNVLIELDCGLGKRFLQYSLINSSFPDSRMILLLQASTSLYETYNYMKKHLPKQDIAIIDSRLPSSIRAEKLKQHRVILSLPQTLSNTLKKYPDAIDATELVVINEIDQIIKRIGVNQSLKQPYPKLFRFFMDKMMIGMSGTLRDTHYIFDQEQVKIKQELLSLIELIDNTALISMDMIMESDIQEHISYSNVIATGVDDQRLAMISIELNQHIAEAKETLMKYLKEENRELYEAAKHDFTKLLGPLPVPPKINQKFQRGYLVRKYLWAMTGENSFHHLVNYGVDQTYLTNNLPRIPGKFFAVRKLVEPMKKSVILCSYIDTVDTIQQLLEARDIKTVVITGKVPIHKRASALDEFRESDTKMVAILSNVGERDLDIPEAELLIVFDLIRTVKTVYQKLKRSRGGECRILYYEGTAEEKKVHSVLKRIEEKYSWSTKILPGEKLDILE